MYKKIVSPLLFILLLGCSYSQNAKNLVMDDFTIQCKNKSTFSLLDDIQSIEAKFGTPSDKIIKSFEFGDYIELVYDGLTVGYFSDTKKIYTISITGKKCFTKRGITVGAKYSDVIEKYGISSNEILKDGKVSLVLYSFALKNNTKNLEGEKIIQLYFYFSEDMKVESADIRWET